MAVDKSLVSGSTGMLLLKLLSEKDMYGYEMIETLRERKYYSITKQGRKALAEKQDEWKNYAHAVLSVLEAGGVV